jgi:AraC-like DNA-binding protein
LRAPDLRLVGLTFEDWRLDRPFLKSFPDTRRACFYYVKRGAAWFRTGPAADELHHVTQGMAIGVEGHAHEWMDRSHVHISDVRRVIGDIGVEHDMPVEILASSIDRSAAVLQRLPHGAIIIPADASPYSDMIHGCSALIDIERASGEGESGVTRRLAEIIMLQLVAYARSRLLHGITQTEGLAHDEYILRAMTAFFVNPGEQWTVHSLATAAGLSRAAFSERFTRAFGEPPLKTINRLRLQQASEMLLGTNASLSDIATQIGFGSAAAFLRAFKRQFDKTPGEWRGDARSKQKAAPV